MRPLSFSGRLKAGWSKVDLMRYYALDEPRYNKVIESLDCIKNEVNK